ncbi:MAG: hypothetical protein ACRC7R_10610, partial [Sarcina sp.]
MRKYPCFFWVILVLLSFLLGACKKDSDEENKVNKIKNLPDNIILQINDNELKYKQLNNGRLNDINI